MPILFLVTYRDLRIAKRGHRYREIAEVFE